MSPAEFRAARERLGLSLDGMAQALEVTKRAVAFWEDGERAISGPVRVALRLMLAPAPRRRLPAARRGTPAALRS